MFTASVPEFTIENLTGMVDVVVSAASTMETSHTEVQLFEHDIDIVCYCCLLFIHAHF